MIPDPTARLVFRTMSEADLDPMAELLGDPDVMRFYPRPKTRDEALAWIRWNERSYRDHGYGLWIVETHEGEFVGDCGLTWQPVGGAQVLEVGYHVRTAHQGGGLATETARACLDLARGPIGERHVVAIIDPANLASRRVAEKIGMTLEQETEVRGLPVVVYGTSTSERPRLTLMCGVAGAGKSTYARRLEAQGRVRFSIDREVFDLGYLAAAAVPDDVAADVRARQRVLIVETLGEDRDVVVDYSFWSRAQRDDYRALGQACGADVDVVFLDVPADVLRRRLAARRGAHADDVVVDAALLDRYLAGFEAPAPDEPGVRVVAGEVS